jgi:phosphoribosyl-ATP pyrophosphohydrolase
MSSPRRIFRIYQQLAQDARQLREQLAAKGEKSGTLDLLASGDRAKLLARWGEEMAELCGVLNGTHNDSFLMESTQTFYWGALYAVTGGATWDTIGFDAVRRQAATCSIDTVPELVKSVERLVGLGAPVAKPEKLFLLWNAADWIYRRQTKPDDQWTLEQLMEADLQDMKKRSYLEPILQQIQD